MEEIVQDFDWEAAVAEIDRPATKANKAKQLTSIVKRLLMLF
jgi:hypothetical protein